MSYGIDPSMFAGFGQQQAPNPYNYALLGALPGFYNTNYQQQILEEQRRALGANRQYNTGYMNQQLGFNNQGYNLNMQGIGNQQDYLNQQQDFLYKDYQFGIQGNNIDWNAISRQLGHQPQLRNIQGQQFGLSEADIKRESANDIRRISSDFTARGALGSEGFRQDMKYEQSELSDALAGVGLNRQQYEIEQGEREAALGDQQKRITLAQEKLALDLDKGYAGIDTQMKALDLAAAKAGLSRDEVSARIRHSIGQLGIDYAADDRRIALEIAKLDAGLQTQFPADLLALIKQMSGF